MKTIVKAVIAIALLASTVNAFAAPAGYSLDEANRILHAVEHNVAATPAAPVAPATHGGAVVGGLCASHVGAITAAGTGLFAAAASMPVLWPVVIGYSVGLFGALEHGKQAASTL